MSSITLARDPVSEPLAAVLQVFAAHEAALCFPEVDHASLQALAAELRQAAAEVERCERALHQARLALDDRRDALRTRAERGLAYARIYAEDDPKLRERLEAIDLPAATEPGKRTSKRHPPRRGRRTKPAVADETVEELRFVAGQPGAARAGAA